MPPNQGGGATAESGDDSVAAEQGRTPILRRTAMTSESPCTCAHPACGCPVPSSGAYCSEHCRQHAGSETCDCGHAHCTTSTSGDGEKR